MLPLEKYFLDAIFRRLLYYHNQSWVMIVVVALCLEYLEPFLLLHEIFVELKMVISIAILTVWAGEVKVFVFQLIYFLSEGWEQLFQWLLELVYLELVWPTGFYWPPGSRLFVIVLLIKSLLGIVLAMVCWDPCIAAVVALLFFIELLVVVFIFVLVPILLLSKHHSFWCIYGNYLFSITTK